MYAPPKAPASLRAGLKSAPSLAETVPENEEPSSASQPIRAAGPTSANIPTIASKTMTRFIFHRPQKMKGSTNKGSNFSHCSSVISDACFVIKNSFLQQSVHKSLPIASLTSL
jgi:hypothetical protein